MGEDGGVAGQGVIGGACVAVVVLVLSGCTGAASTASPVARAVSTQGSVSAQGSGSADSASTQESHPVGSSSVGLPRPAHTVVVVMENHPFDAVIGSPAAPWVNSLGGAVMTDWHGVTHPSQGNYVAMFTGSTQGVHNDQCPQNFDAPNLASQLQGAGLSFTGYSEDLPGAGSTVCGANGYARKHNPWVDVTSLGQDVNQPLTRMPNDYASLPTVSFVVPNLCHDTHDCPVRDGDVWLKDTFSGYVDWATTHDSLLVITYDEDDNSSSNHIPTLFVGPMVTPGTSATHGDHYTMLRTLEALYDLPGLGEAASRAPLTDIWQH